jgi:hypothetical protein
VTKEQLVQYLRVCADLADKPGDGIAHVGLAHLRQAITLLEPAVEPSAEPAKIDDLIALGDKFILPADVTIGAGTFRKGVKVGTMLRCLKNHAQYATATPYDPAGLQKAFEEAREAATDDEPCTECKGTGWDRMRERECDCVREPDDAQ